MILPAAAGLLVAAQPTLATSNASKNSPARYPSSVPGEAAAAGNQSAVAGGALFGGNVPLIREAPRLGRSLAIIRIYAHIGDTFPGANRHFLAAGSTALVSLDSNGTSYSAIAAGLDDRAITSFLESVDQAAIQYQLPAIYVSFEHEPDNSEHSPLGTPGQFVQAWDHVHHLAEAGHLDWKAGGRLHWIWILLHSAFAKGRASQFWPGTNEVAGIGVDGYNSLGCKPATGRWNVGPPQTPSAIFNPAIRFAESKGGLPVFISEWGSNNLGLADTQPAFIRQMQSYVTHNREIAAALYWDSSGPTCSYILGNPASLAAIAAMARSSALQGRITTPLRWRGTWPMSPVAARHWAHRFYAIVSIPSRA
ncbi:MAG TPA: hypothetical protein VGI74_15535 [Streptosporangiaceae bacterium]